MLCYMILWYLCIYLGNKYQIFQTICRFRGNHEDTIEEIYKQVVGICKMLEMVGGENVYYDGTN